MVQQGRSCKEASLSASITLASFSQCEAPKHVLLMTEALQKASDLFDGLIAVVDIAHMEVAERLSTPAVVALVHDTWQRFLTLFAVWTHSIASLLESFGAFARGEFSNTVPHAIRATLSTITGAETVSKVHTGQVKHKASLSRTSPDESMSMKSIDAAPFPSSGMGGLIRGRWQPQTVCTLAIDALPSITVRTRGLLRVYVF